MSPIHTKGRSLLTYGRYTDLVERMGLLRTAWRGLVDKALRGPAAILRGLLHPVQVILSGHSQAQHVAGHTHPL